MVLQVSLLELQLSFGLAQDGHRMPLLGLWRWDHLQQPLVHLVQAKPQHRWREQKKWRMAK
jgi:hypothetical protein